MTYPTKKSALLVRRGQRFRSYRAGCQCILIRATVVASGKLTGMSGELEKWKSLTVGADFQLP